MAYSPEKIQALENALRKTAELVGKLTETPNQDGVKTGLDLTNESLICNHAADAVKDGVFKVVVMGSFCTGKTSVINALSGSRILPDTVLPTTPVISYLRYGTDDKKIHVYKNDKSVEEMSYEVFFNKYKFSNEDAEEARKTGMVKRFSDVEYSVFYSNMPLLKNGVQLLDTTGLEEKDYAAKIFRLASDANAIIYMGNAIRGGFNINDREFLKSNFEGRHLNNVFFLINKSDCLTEEELEEIKSYYKVQLTNLFTDENGDFNEDLYAKRVFFVSARNVLKKRTGEESYDDRDIPAFERFEKELEEFFTTDARSIATFNSCFTKIANAYKASMHTADMNKSICENGVDSVKEELAIVEHKLKQMEGELSAFQKSFDIAKTRTEHVIRSRLNSLVGEIDETWDAEINEIVESAGFRLKDFLVITWHAIRCFNHEEQINEAFEDRIRPITNGVTEFIQRKCEESLSDIEISTQPIIDELRKEIDSREVSLSMFFEEIYSTFKVEGSANVENEGISPIKLLAFEHNNDKNMLVQIIAGYDMGWKDFLKHTIIEIVFSVVGGSTEVALFLLRYWWARQMGHAHYLIPVPTPQQMMSQFVSKMQMKINREEDGDVYAKIRETFDEAFTIVSKGVNARITGERRLLADMQRKLDDASYVFETEIERCEYVTKKIWDSARDAYMKIFEREISLEGFLKIKQ